MSHDTALHRTASPLRAARALLAVVAFALALPHAAGQVINRDVSGMELVKEVDLDAPVGFVWRAWTEPDAIAEFFAPRAKIDLRIGGDYELSIMPDAPAGERGTEGCRVLSYLPQRMLSFSWNAPPKFPAARSQHTWVVLEMAPRADGKTHLRLTHYGFGRGDEWNQVYAYFDRAWGNVLASLGEYAGRAGRKR